MLTCLLFSAQVAERDFFLDILEKSGLRRSQQGAAIILTGRDFEEEVVIADLAVMRKDEMLNLKKVPHCMYALQHRFCAALSLLDMLWCIIAERATSPDPQQC